MTTQELLDFISRYDTLVYGFLLVYALGKTGPLPMVAGFVSFSGALNTAAVLALVLLGTVMGSQIRFWVGRRFSPWLYARFPGFAPWLALGSAVVERYCNFLLPAYRFSKGTFTLVGLGAGASRLPWLRFALADSVGAIVWTFTWVGLGVGFAYAGAQVDPRWAAYAGLSLLVAGMLVAALFGRYLKTTLEPYARAALSEARNRQTSRNGPSQRLAQ
jgi:membrane protein DedA with SNARE-associated domain